MYAVRVSHTVGAAMSESERTTRRMRSETRRPGSETLRSRAASEIRPATGPRSLVSSEYASGSVALKQEMPKRMVAPTARGVSGIRSTNIACSSAVTGR